MSLLRQHSESESVGEAEERNDEFLHYFMNIAILKAKTRSNYKNQAGACIINAANRIVGIGNYTELKLNKGALFSWFKKSKLDYGK